jgi:ribose 5-phosphate isomerase RpiB
MERVRRFTIDPKRLGFFKAILESYEEVAIMSVLDGKRGEMKVTYPACQEEILVSIMADMERFGIVFKEAAGV